jgi:hypothetical protein
MWKSKKAVRIAADTAATTALAFVVAEETATANDLGNLSGGPLSVYLMTGTLTGLLGNRVLLMSRIKTLIPCSPLAIPWAVPRR